jgi:hypothetical protein
LAGNINGDDGGDGSDFLQIQRDRWVLIPLREVQYDTGTGSLSSAGSVTEPASLLVCILGVLMAAGGRNR